MNKNNKIKINNTTVIFKLEEILKTKKVTKYELEKVTGIDHKTIQNYCLGIIKRIDLRVLITICEFLECEVFDIIEFKIEK